MKRTITLTNPDSILSLEPIEALKATIDRIIWPPAPRLKFYLASGYRLENLDLKKGRIGSSTLRKVILKHVNFEGAYITDCRFDTCKITDTSFMFAYMPSTIFYKTSFDHCDFTGMEYTYNTYFIACEFIDCDFHSAGMDGRNFVKCYFYDCGFRTKSIEETFSAGNNFFRCTDMPYLPMVCPDKGAFFGFKKAHAKCTESGHSYWRPCIVELYVPKWAKRSSAGGRKCRCSDAIIIDAWDLTGATIGRGAIICSFYGPDFTYRIGDNIHIEDFDENRWDECGAGFHFFMNEEEARNYN